MTPYEIIAKKRDGKKLLPAEIDYFIQGFARGSIEPYHMSAFLMAVYFKGMSEDEIIALTRSYIQSGEVVEFPTRLGFAVDKHSTGGVGDKISLILAPLVASLGVPVPMISGRGLGHTGGTLDKLESIPGFTVDCSIASFKKQVEELNLAMIGQTNSIVPADRKIYAIRDVTATIESLPLIAASIISKKVAEGIQGLVLDVKFGSGAFMKEKKSAEQLANLLIKTGNAFGKKVVAYLTSMDQPLGLKIGNWLEVEESIECLQGRGPEDIRDLTLTLAGEMLVLAGKVTSQTQAREKCRIALEDGSAFRKFLELVEYQGGDTRFILHPEAYPQTDYAYEVPSPASGCINAFNSLEIGRAAVALGAGRLKTGDGIDPAAGIVLHKKVGQEIRQKETIFTVFSKRKTLFPEVAQRLLAAVTIGQNGTKPGKLVYKRIGD